MRSRAKKLNKPPVTSHPTFSWNAMILKLVTAVKAGGIHMAARVRKAIQRGATCRSRFSESKEEANTQSSLTLVWLEGMGS